MQQQSELPEGWVSANVSDICQLINGRAFKPSDWSDKGLPIIRIQNLNNVKAKFNYCDFEVGSKYYLNSGQLLFAWSGTPGTSFGAHIWERGKAVLNQHIFRVEIDENTINKLFLKHSLNYNIAGYIEKAHGTAGLAHITKKKFETSVLSFPPLAEQHRIVSAIESLFVRLDAANERLDRVPEILKKFRQSVLAAACDGRLTEEWRTLNEDKLNIIDSLNNLDIKNIELDVSNDSEIQLNIPQEWKWSLCNDLCDQNRALTYGVIKLGSEAEDGVPTLRSSDVRWLKIDTNHIKRISPEIASNYSRTFLKGGEILVTVRGTLGGVAVVPQKMKGFNISREVAVIPLINILDAHFFCYAIASKRSQNWLLGMKKGVAYIGINIKDLKNLPLPIPPLSEQHEIVRRVDALFALADSIEAKVAAARERTEKLRQSILAKAFSGELVPTEAELARHEGRDYESADVLLERIKAEQGKGGKKGE